MSGFYSLIFYPTALLTVYLLTSTSRTAAARFWLFVLFGCSLALERCIVHLTVSDDCAYVPADEASVSASRIRTVHFCTYPYYFNRKKCIGGYGLWENRPCCFALCCLPISLTNFRTTTLLTILCWCKFSGKIWSWKVILKVWVSRLILAFINC